MSDWAYKECSECGNRVHINFVCSKCGGDPWGVLVKLENDFKKLKDSVVDLLAELDKIKLVIESDFSDMLKQHGI